jgi:hypothetical protein
MMAGLDPSAAARIVESLDRELERRQARKDEAEDKRWAAECGGDEVIMLAKRLERNRDRHRNKESRASIPTSPEDVECLLEEALENATSLFLLAEMVERDEQGKADEAAGIRRRPKVTHHVRRVAKLVPESPRSKLDPAAPKVVERTGRRRSEPALAMPGTPEAEGRWLRGVVATWNARTHEGMILAADGAEYRLADGVLMRSGLVTLIAGMRAEFRVVGSECDWVRAAWH